VKVENAGLRTAPSLRVGGAIFHDNGRPAYFISVREREGAGEKSLNRDRALWTMGIVRVRLFWTKNLERAKGSTHSRRRLAKKGPFVLVLENRTPRSKLSRLRLGKGDRMAIMMVIESGLHADWKNRFVVNGQLAVGHRVRTASTQMQNNNDGRQTRRHNHPPPKQVRGVFCSKKFICRFRTTARWVGKR